MNLHKEELYRSAQSSPDVHYHYCYGVCPSTAVRHTKHK